MKLTTSAPAEVDNPTGQDIDRLLSGLPVNPDYEAVIAAAFALWWLLR